MHLLWGLVPTVLVAIFMQLTWPYAKPRIYEYVNDPDELEDGQEDIKGEPGLKITGVYVYTVGKEVFLTTTIKLLDKNGKESYVDGLSQNNFEIHEDDGTGERSAPIIGLKHIKESREIYAILLVDKSYSMNELSGVGTQTKIGVARSATLHFVEQLVQWKSTHIAILPFSGLKAGSKNFLSRRDGNIWWDHTTFQSLNDPINRLRAKGDTPLWQAINTALEQMHDIDNQFYKIIICLTDGIDTAKGIPYDFVLKKAKQRQIPIFTLCYGTLGQADDNQLVELSKVSGAGERASGSFLRIPPKDWSSKLTSIRDDISHLYDVYWQTTGKTPGTEVKVKIKVSYSLNGEPFVQELERMYKIPEDKED